MIKVKFIKKIKKRLKKYICKIKSADENILKCIRVSTHTRNAHQAARDYWSGCSCSLLASDPTYYDRQEDVLRNRFMSIIGQFGRGLDIGCGNGRFSLVIAEWGNSVDAVDISSNLIDQARRAAKSLGVENVNFEVVDLESDLPSGNYDLIACMGVMSTIINDEPFRDLCDYIVKSLNNDGWLILKDTLSTDIKGELINTPEYTTHYRNQEYYLNIISQNGFKKIDEVLMAEGQGRVNYMYLFKKYF